jgi:ATP-dependent DNA ligase
VLQCAPEHDSGVPVHFFIFDLLILRGRDVMAEPLLKRRALIEKHVLPTLADPIRYAVPGTGNARVSVREFAGGAGRAMG